MGLGMKGYKSGIWGEVDFNLAPLNLNFTPNPKSTSHLSTSTSHLKVNFTPLNLNLAPNPRGEVLVEGWGVESLVEG